MRFEDVQRAIEIVIADSQTHAGLLDAIVIQGHAGFEADLAEGAVVTIAEHPTGRGIAGDIDIGPAVVIEVRRNRGQSVAAAHFPDSGFGRNIRERAIAIVAIKQRGNGGEAARSAHHWKPFPGAVTIGPGHRGAGRIEIHVMRHEKIEQAIAIVIHPGAAGAPALDAALESGGRGDIGKGAVAVIAVEDVLAVIGDEEVFKTIVIVVTDANGGGPSSLYQTGIGRDIGERAVAPVLVEAIGRAFGRPIEARAVQHQNIHPAVVIVIEESATASRGFEDILLGFKIAVDDGMSQSGRLGDVGEAGVKGEPGGFSTRQRAHVARGNTLGRERRGGEESEQVAPVQRAIH